MRSERDGGSFTFLSPFPSGVVPQVYRFKSRSSEVAAWRGSRCRRWLFFLEPHETVFIFPTKANGTYSISS